MKSGQKKLLDAFNIWSAGLSKHSVEAVYAIMAVNWATHVKLGSPILANTLATWSIAICVLFIIVNISITGILTQLNKDRWQEAEDKTESWIDDFQNRNDEKSEWPFTNKIDNYGLALLYIKVFVPLMAGGLFLFSLFK